MSKKQVVGVVASFTLVKASEKSGYETFDVVFEGGEHCKVTVRPEDKGIMEPGVKLTCVKGQFNNWMYEKDLPEEVQKEIPMNKDEYWLAKDKYTNEVTNPKIEFQRYLDFVGGIYQEAMKSLTKPPKTLKDLDMYIDEAYLKTKQIYELRQKDFEKE